MFLNLLRPQLIHCLLKRSTHSKMTILESDSCFLCFHKDQEHPYEHTLPVPKKKENPSIFKDDFYKEMFDGGPNLEQVQMLTRTPASRWANHDGNERRKKYKDSFNKD